MKPSRILLTPLAILALGTTTFAATINFSTAQYGSGSGTIEVSVYSGDSYINGDVTSTTISDVVDYAFFHANPAAADLAGSSTVLPTSVTSPLSSSSRENIKFYTTNNPTNLVPNATFNQLTVGSNNTLTGTVNFAALPGGTGNAVTLYLLHGGWINFQKVTLSDGVNTWTHNIARGSVQASEYVTAITFTDFSLSDTFTYSLSNSNNNPTFIGAIVTQAAVPEPASLALMGLGGLMIASRRRKA